MAATRSGDLDVVAVLVEHKVCAVAILNVRDPLSVIHGFVRDADGTFAEFDAPDAGTADGQGTVGFEINKRGNTTGWYMDSGNRVHGFLRTP